LKPRPIATGRRVCIRAPGAADVAELVELAHVSRPLHRPWVYPPQDAAGFRAYLERTTRETHRGHLVCLRDGGTIVGVVNVSEIVGGALASAYLGYYVHAKHAGRGYLREGLALVIRRCFRELGLHRLEANVQPGNAASLGLVRSLGFRLEGYSPRYLKVGGRWRDHERWAILVDEWTASKRGKRSGG
jgi:ribosomal-protein-alanine N-acetyltransferase